MNERVDRKYSSETHLMASSLIGVRLCTSTRKAFSCCSDKDGRILTGSTPIQVWMSDKFSQRHHG